jgi:hypothetical protein
MATLYNKELNGLLDRILPQLHFVRRPRPSDPFSDKKCREAKRLTRRLERAFAAASCRAVAATAASKCAADPDVVATVAEAASAKTVWYNQRRSYRQLRCWKSADFWRSKIEADQCDPRKLWRSVDVLLGRGCVQPSSEIDVEIQSIFCR